MTQAVIYTRFSPRRNAEESKSCETQEAICRAYAERQGWQVRSVHKDEGVSGDTWPREGLEEALASVQRGDVLLVWKRDRIARRVLLAELVQHQVTRSGARVAAVEGDVAADDSPESVLVRQVLAAVAEFERKQIAARTKVTMLAQQRAGKRVGRYPPYGFSFDPEDKSRLVPNEAEQAAIERVKHHAQGGLTPYKIAKKLDEELPGACRGKSWSVRTVRKILARQQ